MWSVPQTGIVYYMRENTPYGDFDIGGEDVKHLGVLITTTGVGVLFSTDDTLKACQTLAAARSYEHGGSGPVDCVQLLSESEGLPFVPLDELSPENKGKVPTLGVDMWIDDEGLLLDSKHYNPFASVIAERDIYGDVVIFGCREGETLTIPFPAFEKLQTAEWMGAAEGVRFIKDHPTRGFWTLEEARVIIDSLDEMGRALIAPSDEDEETIKARFIEQSKKNRAATMFADLGYSSDDYREMMKEAAELV